jgi:transglutaminase/protease-like cytokinesis protein 3
MNYSGTIYYKNFNEEYFLTRPEDFIRDHYPEDPQWAFLPSPPTVREFKYSPFTTTSFMRNKITSFKPSNGILEASVGDTLKFEVETDAWEKDMFVVDTAFADSVVISNPVWRDAAKPKINGRKITCTYVVPAENIEWLNVVVNGEIVIRYKLNVRKTYTAAN